MKSASVALVGAFFSAIITFNTFADPTNCVPAPAGLVSWWRAEGGTSDSAGTNHGTLAGNTAFSVGRVGQAFALDGNGDAVSVGSANNLQLQDFTIEAWVKRASSSVVSSGGTAVLFGYGTGGYAFGLLNDGRLFLSKVEIDQTQTTAAVTDTNLHHVAVTKSGTTVVFSPTESLIQRQCTTRLIPFRRQRQSEREATLSAIASKDWLTK